VDLVEVDRVNAESPETGLRLPQDRVALQAVDNRVVRACELRGLGEHVRALTQTFKCAPDDLL
jgi:hypothetical protein